MAAITGYTVGYKRKDKSLVKSILFILVATTIAAFLGNIISYFISKYIFNIIFFSSMKLTMIKLLIPSLIISTITTIVTTSIEYFRHHNRLLLSEIENTKKKQQSTSISIKEQESHYLLNYVDIIYLSASANRTMFHTEKKDYETIQLLKNVENKLPNNKFVRIHKKYIVNIDYIQRIQYYKGGQYLAYLKDEDETTLTIGRAFVAKIKDKLAF